MDQGSKERIKELMETDRTPWRFTLDLLFQNFWLYCGEQPQEQVVDVILLPRLGGLQNTSLGIFNQSR
jgi:hypothetical protein